MLVKIKSVGFLGLEVSEVTVEVNISYRGFPGFEIVGLAGRSIRESKERVKAGIINSGFKFPSDKKIVVNLAPADFPKEGSMYDLPIAAGILQASGQINPSVDYLYLGEISLDGSLRYTRGGFLIAHYAKQNKYKGVVIPWESRLDAGLVGGVRIITAKSISEIGFSPNAGAFADTAGNFGVQTLCEPERAGTSGPSDLTLCDIIGQESAKRALQICVAGGHHLLLSGPPGVGKSMLARSALSLLPSADSDELMEVMKIYSLAGTDVPLSSLIGKRPFRSPHHTTSISGLLGGGAGFYPGELSLAHRGILFLDELAEFPDRVLGALRQPIEDGYTEIIKNSRSVRYPCRFTLIAATNPCPCGFRFSQEKKCSCTEFMIQKYKKRLSGPLMDRIDLFINMPPVNVDNLARKEKISLTVSVDKLLKKRNDVMKARGLQDQRFQNHRFRERGMHLNSEMDIGAIKEFCYLDKESKEILTAAVSRLNLSMRAYYKVIKVARTIADLEESTNISSHHVLEAISFKNNFDQA